MLKYEMGPFLTLLLILLFACVFAWDRDGHEAIGMTAMSALKGKAVSQVKRLMNGKDVVDVSGWAHLVNAKYPATKAMHFQAQSTQLCELDISICPNNLCLYKALRHFYGRLTGSTDAQDMMTYPDSLSLTDSDAVKFLINLIGDMHQPLHIGFTGDDMGRNTTTTYKGEKASLFDIWDRLLVQNAMRERPSFWNGGWTHVNAIKAEFEKERKEFEEQGADIFKAWMQDNLNVACTRVYRNPATAEWLKGDFEVTASHDKQWFETLQKRLLLAGARTAIVLNAILETRDAQKLRVGSGVTGIVDPLDEAALAGKKRAGKLYKLRDGTPKWVTALGTNVVIIVVVVIAFLYIMRFYGGASHRHVPQPTAGHKAPKVADSDEKTT
eukprot:Platyproteum_vivax@DN3770_c0_g1_i2.p1